MKTRIPVLLEIAGLALCVAAPRWAAAQTAPAVGDALATNIFIYEVQKVDDKEVVQRIRMSADEADVWYKALFDQYVEDYRNGKIPNAPSGLPAHAVAAWKIYYEQLELWQRYIKEVVLEDDNLKATIDEITWTRGGTPVGGAAPGAAGPYRGPEALVAANQNRSLDEQTGDFFRFGSSGAAGDTAAQGPIKREDIKKQVDELYEVIKGQAKELDEKIYKMAIEFVKGLEERRDQRNAYRTWLDEQKDLVVETAMEWGKRQQGELVEVDGVRYELYSPVLGMPKGEGRADVVRVISESLSPYDILNPDGSLRLPAGQ